MIRIIHQQLEIEKILTFCDWGEKNRNSWNQSDFIDIALNMRMSWSGKANCMRARRDIRARLLQGKPNVRRSINRVSPLLLCFFRISLTLSRRYKLLLEKNVCNRDSFSPRGAPKTPSVHSFPPYPFPFHTYPQIFFNFCTMTPFLSLIHILF